MAHQGSWLGLPDFGVSEWLQSKISPSKAYASSGGSNLIGRSAPAQTPSVSNQPALNYNFPIPQGQVLGSRSSGGSSGSQPSYQNQSMPGQEVLQNDINNQVDDFGAIIDRDYETAMGALSGQESTIRGQAASATQSAEAGYAPARTQIANEQATKEQGVQKELVTGETSASTSLQQARDLFRQIQQQNVAQLSGSGISSSSVNEALAEKLGVETARRIGGITSSLTEIRQNAAQELTRVKTYYQSKLSDLETQLGAAKANIQTQLMAGINQINQARNQAAADKANRRQELITNAQTALSNLAAKAQEFQQSLQMWNEQKTAALTPIVQDPNYIQTMLANMQTIQQAPGMNQYDIGANINQNAQGQMYGSYNIKPKKEEIVNPFANPV